MAKKFKSIYEDIYFCIPTLPTAYSIFYEYFIAVFKLVRSADCVTIWKSNLISLISPIFLRTPLTKLFCQACFPMITCRFLNVFTVNQTSTNFQVQYFPSKGQYSNYEVMKISQLISLYFFFLFYVVSMAKTLAEDLKWRVILLYSDRYSKKEIAKLLYIGKRQSTKLFIYMQSGDAL